MLSGSQCGVLKGRVFARGHAERRDALGGEECGELREIVGGDEVEIGVEIADVQVGTLRLLAA